MAFSYFHDNEIWLRVLDAVPDHVAVIDSTGRIVGVNAAWERFSDENGGNRVRTCLGSNYFETCRLAAVQGAPEAQAFMTELQAVLRGSQSEVEIPYPCHSPRELRWFAARAARITVAGETFAAVLHTNVTVRTLLNQRLVEMNRDLKDARRKEIVQEWTSFLAHEIKNPLSAIALRGQMLKRILTSSGQSADPRALESCEVILRTTRKIVGLMDSTRPSASYDPGPVETVVVEDLLKDLAAVSKGWFAFTGTRVEVEKMNGSPILQAHRLRLSLAVISVIFHFLGAGEERVLLGAEADREVVLLTVSAETRLVDRISGPDLLLAEKLISSEAGTLSKRTHGAREIVTLAVPRTAPRITPVPSPPMPLAS